MVSLAAILGRPIMDDQDDSASERLTRLTCHDTLELLGHTGRAAQFAVIAHARSDALYYSGLDPSVFVIGTELDVPHLLLHLDDGAWIAVDDSIQIGYSGSGPGRTERFLGELGIPADIAADVAHNYYFCDLDVAGATIVDSTPTQRRYPLGMPERRGSRWVLRVDEPPEVFRLLIDFLDKHGAEFTWMRGPRRARLYFDAKQAGDDGFSDHPGAWPRQWGGPDVHAYNVILEQGELQIWTAAWSLRGEVGSTYSAGIMPDAADQLIAAAGFALPPSPAARPTVHWSFRRRRRDLRPHKTDDDGILDFPLGEPTTIAVPPGHMSIDQ
jgi:hypothetical protein